MKFSAQEDIEAPLSAVWDTLSEVEAFERAAMRRGADVMRADRSAGFRVGAAWKVQFPFRGKDREADIVIENIEAPRDVHVSFGTVNLTGSMRVELLALSRSQTRFGVHLEVRPLNLSAGLLIQSLKLTKVALNKRFRTRIAEYCAAMEQQLKVFDQRFTLR